jgi:hypothetical protein
MLLDVKQKSESDADILLSRDHLTVRSVQIGVGWLAHICSDHSIGVGTPHRAKAVRQTAFCCGLGTDLLVRPCHL